MLGNQPSLGQMLPGLRQPGRRGVVLAEAAMRGADCHWRSTRAANEAKIINLPRIILLPVYFLTLCPCQR